MGCYSVAACGQRPSQLPANHFFGDQRTPSAVTALAGLGCLDLKRLVRSVAEARRLGVLATAKVNGGRFRRVVFHRRKSGAAMAAVAEWLVCAAPADAPEIRFRGFHLDGVRASLGDDWLRNAHDKQYIRTGPKPRNARAALF
jgi:hypothetical protein